MTLRLPPALAEIDPPAVISEPRLVVLTTVIELCLSRNVLVVDLSVTENRAPVSGNMTEICV
jgi:hypothetical protein